MMFTSIVLYLVLTGYNITFNATEYEFDVSVHSVVGTVVFDALLIVENITAFMRITVSFSGTDTQDTFDLPRTNPLLTITLTEILNSDDENVDQNFTIHYNAVTFTGVIYANSVNVILHEIGKSTSYNIIRVKSLVEFFEGQNFNRLAL